MAQLADAMSQISGRLRTTRVIPVVEVPSVSAALPLAEAIIAGGLECIEVTLRTPAGLEALAAIRSRHPQLLLAAGTVLTVEQVERSLACGVDFIVAPGLSATVATACVDLGVPFVPGVCTPTEIELARSFGVDLLKFFPAEAIGGVDFLKAICAPYRDLWFLPTGGIGPVNLASYLKLPQVVACGGSWMASPALIAAGAFDEIRRTVANAVAVAQAA